MNVPRRNVELKARDADPARSLSACASLGAEEHGVLRRDTYFDAANGRLKIREQDGDRPHLIAYERPNLSGQRESRYRIVEVQNVEELKAALSDTLGVKVVVTKERRLFLGSGTCGSISMRSRELATSSSSRPSPKPTQTSTASRHRWRSCVKRLASVMPISSRAATTTLQSGGTAQ